MIVLTTEIKRINYKSDFDFILRINAVGDDGELTEVGVPDYDWEIVLSSGSNCRGMGARTFTASSKEGVMTNCFIDNGNIHIVCNNHGLRAGVLYAEFHAHLPNAIYPDGERLFVGVQKLPIELVVGESDEPTEIEVQVSLPYIYASAYDMAVANGYEGSMADYVKLSAELPNAVETANAVSASVESLENSSTIIDGAKESLSNTAESISLQSSRLKDSADSLAESAEEINTNVSAIEMLSSEWADGRRAIATALTNRRYPTEPTESFHAMAEKVENMSYEEGWFAKIGYTDENASALKEMIDYSYELAKVWNPDGSISSLFEGNKNILFYPIVDTSQIPTAERMFYETTQLVFVPNLSLPKASSTAYMFNQSGVIKVGDIDIPNAKTTRDMFSHASKLTHIGAINSPKAKDMHYTFNVTSIKYVKSVDVGCATGLNAFITSGILFICMKNLGKSTLATYNFSNATNWGVESNSIPDARQSLIDSLITYSYDRASNGMPTATITLSTNTKALLTDEEIAQITSKGFTIA